jgi:hypothetical protein
MLRPYHPSFTEPPRLKIVSFGGCSGLQRRAGPRAELGSPSASAGFWLPFDPEEGGDMFLRILGFSLNYTQL